MTTFTYDQAVERFNEDMSCMNRRNTMKQIIWADGHPTKGLEMEVSEEEGVDYEHAANLLGCEVNAVNVCSWETIDYYGITLISDFFLRPKGAA